MAPADSGDDPNIAPYPGRYEIARIKGIAPNEDPVPGRSQSADQGHLDVAAAR